MKCKATFLSVSLFLTSFLAVAQISLSSNVGFRANMNPEKSIVQNTEDSGNHNILLAAVRAADLEEILGQDGPFTVFAPSDKAFKKLSKEKMASLLEPSNKKELYAILTYHIVAGKFTASKILKAMCRGNGKATFTTVQGNKITAKMRGLDIILSDELGNEAKIIMADIDQCNGVVHEIDSVILPLGINL